MTDRIPYGSLKTMTIEERREHRRVLQRRWRHSHPEWVKSSNKYYAELYKKIKPYVCVCKRCGCQFASSRPYHVLCGHCPTLTEMRRQAIDERRKKREARKKMIVEMYLSGNFTQVELADMFGIAQTAVSKYLREKRLTKKS